MRGRAGTGGRARAVGSPQRAAAVAMVLVLALPAACSRAFDAPPTTDVDPAGPPPLPSPGGGLYGRVLRADGRAASRATAHLVQVRPGDALVAVFSLGFGCLVPQACGNRASARVSSQGAYLFPTEAVQPGLRSVVTATLQPLDDSWTGPMTSAGLADGPDPQEVPDLVGWEPAITVAGEPTRVRLRWPMLTTPLRGAEVRYTVDAILDPGGSSVVRLAGPTERTEAVVDAREFEDAEYQVVVVAETTGAIGGADVAFSYRSPSRPVPLRAGAAPSRGAVCLTDDPSGALQRVENCPLTNGDLERHEAVYAPPCPGASCTQTHRRVCVDLGGSRPVSLVVFRTPFLYDDALVELSPDGRRFTPAGRAPRRSAGHAEVLSVAVDPPRPASVVCLQDDFSGAALREISVW